MISWNVFQAHRVAPREMNPSGAVLVFFLCLAFARHVVAVETVDISEEDLLQPVSSPVASPPTTSKVPQPPPLPPPLPRPGGIPREGRRRPRRRPRPRRWPPHIPHHDCNATTAIEDLNQTNGTFNETNGTYNETNGSAGVQEEDADASSSRSIMGLSNESVFALALVMVVVVFFVAFFVVYVICRSRRNRELYTENIQQARVLVEGACDGGEAEEAGTTVMQDTIVLVGIPKDGQYKATYFANGVACESNWQLKFCKSTDHTRRVWYISGRGADSTGKFTITEGSLSDCGNAYWAQRYAFIRGHCFSTGKFDLGLETFSGDWSTDKGTSGPYVTFTRTECFSSMNRSDESLRSVLPSAISFSAGTGDGGKLFVDAVDDTDCECPTETPGEAISRSESIIAPSETLQLDEMSI